MKNTSQFIDKIKQKISDRHLLKHPFYQAWTHGELELSTIKEYAAQYYHHVNAFPRYISSIHSNCEDLSIRQQLLENLIEEEQGEENHPELWKRFGEGLGNTRAYMKSVKQMKETKALVSTFFNLTKDSPAHVGLAALLSYESMVPEVSESKIEGLKSFYNINDETSLQFFLVHIKADKIHREICFSLLDSICKTNEQKEDALQAVDSALDVLNGFLTGVQKNFC